MYQGNTYIVLDKCVKLGEEHAGKGKHSVEEETPAIKPNVVTLSDELNNETTQRRFTKGEETQNRMKCTVKIIQCSGGKTTSS